MSERRKRTRLELISWLPRLLYNGEMHKPFLKRYPAQLK